VLWFVSVRVAAGIGHRPRRLQDFANRPHAGRRQGALAWRGDRSEAEAVEIRKALCRRLQGTTSASSGVGLDTHDRSRPERLQWPQGSTRSQQSDEVRLGGRIAPSFDDVGVAGRVTPCFGSELGGKVGDAGVATPGGDTSRHQADLTPGQLERAFCS
jgi:hypothetical protein